LWSGEYSELKTILSFLISDNKVRSDLEVLLLVGRKPSFSEVQIIIVIFHKLSEIAKKLMKINDINKCS
jgi:hypothetical protein